MTVTTRDYWPKALKAFRTRLGMTQKDLADRLGVDQATISRWERGLDAPALRMRGRVRDLMRTDRFSRQDRAVRIRVRNGLWPTTLLGRGAVFMEASRATLAEARLTQPDLRGLSIYGAFGERTDDVTHKWERAGIFDGDLALAMSVNLLNADRPDIATYIQTLDTPHFADDGEVWCVCEVRRIEEGEYLKLRAAYGGDSLWVPFDLL